VRIAIAILLVAALSGCAATPGRFEFALIGDQQYNAESDAQFPHLMADIDRAEVDFVVHLGDFKAGTTGPCDDKLFQRRKQQFDASRHPFIYTPGDNEWTDCHNPKAGGFDPVERLAKLREIFFPGKQSLGKRKLALEQQPKFPENQRWRRGSVLFITIHMVGDNNNLGSADEYRERNAANLAWMREGFDLAQREQAAAVAIFAQANPRFERSYPPGRMRGTGTGPPPSRPSGFTDFVAALEKEVGAYAKPVLFAHGDTHYFRIDKPLFRTGVEGPGERGRQLENFTRVEIFGFPEAHWLRIAADPREPPVFSFKEQIVPANRFRKP
jgi:Calcineurin-like phosphoesterase